MRFSVHRASQLLLQAAAAPAQAGRRWRLGGEAPSSRNFQTQIASASGSLSTAVSPLLSSLSDKTLLKTGCLIDGQWLSETPRTEPATHLLPVVNPATGQQVTQVAVASRDDTSFAIASAESAFQTWKKTSARERSLMLYKWCATVQERKPAEEVDKYELVMQHREDLAKILTTEQGKPLAEARKEIDYSASYLRWFSEEAVRAYGTTYPGPAADRRGMTILQPIGVCAAITPWNFPTAMLARKVAACLAAGCTMVAKPSELVPLSALALGELALRAGVPKVLEGSHEAGVFNVVVGDKAVVGHELLGSPTVRKLSFTGSTAAGIYLMQESAATVKRTSMELGGNAPFVVFDDADLAAVVAGLIACKFRNAGQTCVSANRVLVQEGIHDAFVRTLVAKVSGLKVGDGFTEGVEIGPLINEAAVQKVERHVSDAVSKGAEVVCGGGRHPDLGGNFYLPTVLTGCGPEMALAHEETFGPVASIFRFKTEAEALAVANSADAGLAGYVFSNDASRLLRVAEARHHYPRLSLSPRPSGDRRRTLFPLLPHDCVCLPPPSVTQGLEVGMVGMNTGVVSADSTPFGGVKASGHGREGGREGLAEYLEVKALCWGVLPEAKS